MKYTKDQLKTQLDIARKGLRAAYHRKVCIQQPEYQPAKDYGEDVREMHLLKVNNDISHYQKRIIDIKLQILQLQ